MKELILQKESTLIKQVQVYQKNVSFVIVGILKILVINLNCLFVIYVMMVLMTASELKNIAILNVKEVDYRCILWGISKNEAVNILNNSMLEHKGVV